MPPPTTDAPAWFIANGSAVLGSPATATTVDFGEVQNTAGGALVLGQTRSAQVLIYNISKKASLIITDAVMVGADPGDFTFDPGFTINQPIKKSFGTFINISFTPKAKGVRTAAVQLTSNAGTAFITLSGSALVAKPKIAINATALNITPASAPSVLTVTNKGGETLTLQSITVGGTAAGAYQLARVDLGLFGNCVAGTQLVALSSCFLAVGVTPGASAPSDAVLTIRSNDPAHPEMDIPLALTP